MFDVRSLETIEMIAEKVRAAFQRAKVRDLYDLHRFATTPFDGDLLRSLVVLKLWQVRDPFVPTRCSRSSAAASTIGPTCSACFAPPIASSPRRSSRPSSAASMCSGT
jgi:hypothetical protein